MTKNTLMDLNNHLFEQIERLNDDELKDVELDKEIKRARAMTDVARQIIENADLSLQAEKFKDDRLCADRKLPTMLEG